MSARAPPESRLLNANGPALRILAADARGHGGSARSSAGACRDAAQTGALAAFADRPGRCLDAL